MSIYPLRVVDSHSAGEPTRVVLAGGPDLGGGLLAQRCERLIRDFDHWRRAIVLEPRGSEVIVGAWLVEADDPSCDRGVIFFNNVGLLGMCGHGTMGVVQTLIECGELKRPTVRLQTPVGVVQAQVKADRSIAVRNVAAYRYRADVAVAVPGYGTVVGDIAWGGNWFFLCDAGGIPLITAQISALRARALAIAATLHEQGITGCDGARIDHIECCAQALDPQNHGRNFVLCPGGAYDRSPCGTGTSAKMACLYAAGHLQLGEIWRQESILGSVFVGSLELEDQRLIPTIAGKAYVVADSTLIINEDDPFCWGISP